MAETKNLYHPVTGATAEVEEGDLGRYEDNGWLSSDPVEFKDNSWAATNPEAAQAQEQAAADERTEADKGSSASPKQSNTTAADPNAAGVKADAGPSAS
jgi:hypothetical protein